MSKSGFVELGGGALKPEKVRAEMARPQSSNRRWLTRSMVAGRGRGLRARHLGLGSVSGDALIPRTRTEASKRME